MNQKELDEVKQVVNEILASAFREPHSLGFHARGNHTWYCWTTEPILHDGHKRFTSEIRRFTKAGRLYRVSNRRFHARRKDAKARALALWQKGGDSIGADSTQPQNTE